MTVERPRDIEPASFFMLRTPLLPVETLLSLGEGLRAAQANDVHEAESAYAADRALLRHRLRRLVDQPTVREALYIASPDLYDSLDAWSEEAETERAQAVEGALARYIARMAGRATPFGLFAGTSVGALGSSTRLELESQAAYRRHTRLDMEFVSGLAGELANDPRHWASLRFRPNTSLYRMGGQLRMVEHRWSASGRSYDLVAVDDTPELTTTLERSLGGASVAQLASALVDDEISFEDATAYVEELVASQILVAPELEPRITGSDATDALLHSLASLSEAHPVAAALERVQTRLRALDGTPLGAAPEVYAAVAGSLEGQPGAVERNKLFQVDLVKPLAAASLDARVADQMLRATELLRRIGGAGVPRAERLARFRDDFYERYGERKIPLLEALDADLGIDFVSRPLAESAPLLAGLPDGPELASSGTWRAREAHLLQRLLVAVGTGATEIELNDTDIEAMGDDDGLPLPDSFAVMASVATTAEADGFRILIKGIHGQSAVALMGRFCEADPALEAGVREVIAAEEALQPDAVFAEIVHLPQGRTGNVLSRPVLRDYEIVYLGGSGAREQQQLPVADLLVGVEQNRLVLFSERLQRQVIPRLTSAHNYDLHSLGVYAFLGALQEQGVASMPGWTWGALSKAPFLPRVTWGSTVLCRARWNVTGVEVAQLVRGTPVVRFAAVQRWRAERKLPRFVVLADGDNELPIDLDNALSVEALLHGLKQGNGGVIVEQFPAVDQHCVSGPEGHFTNEIVVPFVRTASVSRATVTPPARNVQRTFAPGSEWLYAKLYTGEASADRLLREYIQPLVAHVQGSGAADSWFFLRYLDPEFHIRLRFHGDARRLSDEVLPALESIAARAIEDGLVRRLQLDTYEREVERYGGVRDIELAQAIFHADSEAALAIVAATPGTAGYAARWRAALEGMDGLLDSLGFDLRAKRELARKQRALLARQFGSEAKVRGVLGDRFRAERAVLSTLDTNRPGDPTRRALELRAAALARFPDLERAASFATSLLHMHVNRVIRSAPVAHELVLYEFLGRMYQARLARAGTPA